MTEERASALVAVASVRDELRLVAHARAQENVLGEIAHAHRVRKVVVSRLEVLVRSAEAVDDADGEVREERRTEAIRRPEHESSRVVKSADGLLGARLESRGVRRRGQRENNERARVAAGDSGGSDRDVVGRVARQAQRDEAGLAELALERRRRALDVRNGPRDGRAERDADVRRLGHATESGDVSLLVHCRHVAHEAAFHAPELPRGNNFRVQHQIMAARLWVFA